MCRVVHLLQNYIHTYLRAVWITWRDGQSLPASGVCHVAIVSDYYKSGTLPAPGRRKYIEKFDKIDCTVHDDIKNK